MCGDVASQGEAMTKNRLSYESIPERKELAYVQPCSIPERRHMVNNRLSNDEAAGRCVPEDVQESTMPSAGVDTFTFHLVLCSSAAKGKSCGKNGDIS